ncbi:Nucleotide-binding, alpha-beta plait [Corchorus capsularis]|uniref:Nucleotide-binding, alpha-beta plait n=1 Tax=Corchorus capsularis TaxID=210143 RepID=A0A1R3J7Y3_COCAP|nr:Nucleotide-binding, alpha-beta plait [Corchorus capsularis]
MRESRRSRVVDVFLPFRKRNNFGRFAFVRYRFEDELRNAILRGNGRKLNGRPLVVRKASVRQADRDVFVRSQPYLERGRSVYKYSRNVGRNSLLRYRTVRVVSNRQRSFNYNSGRVFDYKPRQCPPLAPKSAQIDGNGKADTQALDAKVTNGSDKIQMAGVVYPEVQVDGVEGDGTNREVINGGEDDDSMRDFAFSDFPAEKVGPFEDLDLESLGIHWFPKLSLIWISLEDMPLELWHPNFFSVIDNLWGKFIRVDEITSSKRCLSTARLQILTPGVSIIPNLVAGYSSGINFRIGVSWEKDDSTVPAKMAGESKVQVEKPVDVLPDANDNLALERPKIFNEQSFDGNTFSKEIMAERYSNSKILETEVVGESLNPIGSDIGNGGLLIYEGVDQSKELVGADSFNEIHVLNPGHESPFSASPMVSGSRIELRSDMGHVSIGANVLKEKLGRR